MTNKTNLFVQFLVIVLACNCQNSKNEIEIAFTKCLKSKTDKDFKEFVNYLPDECFKIESKDQIILAMENHINNSDEEIEVKEPTIIAIGDRKLIEGKYYSILRYSKKESYKRKSDSLKTEDDLRTLTDVRRMLFEAKYGEENVKFNEVTRALEVYYESQVCAISSNGRTNWKFLFIEEMEESALEQLLPKQLTDGLQNSR